MNRESTLSRLPSYLLLALFVAIAACAKPHMSKLSFSGANEVPPVKTSGKAKGDVTVLPDQTVSGKVTYSGFDAIAAHIHQGAMGKNGPIIIPLNETEKGTLVVPAGAKLNKAQFEAYKAGNLYVNIHSAKHKGGEIRAQIVPPPAK